MKKNILNQSGGIAILVLILLVVGGAVAGWWYFKGKVGLPAGSDQPVSDTMQNADITIDKSGFTPATVSIKKGSQVTWTNLDASPHWVASDPHPTHSNLPTLDSQQSIENKDSYSYIFESNGTFTYHDHLNPLKFKGTVIVTE